MPVGRGCSRSDYCSSWAPEAIKNRVRFSFINCLFHQSVSTDSKDLPLSSPFIISLRLPLNLHFQTPRGKTLIPLQPGKKPNFDKRLCKQQFLYTCKRLLRFPDTSFDHWVCRCCCIWFRHIALSTHGGTLQGNSAACSNPLFRLQHVTIPHVPVRVQVINY